MRVEILETIKHAGAEYVAGETRVVSNELGAYFTGNGWARNIESGEVGERVPGVARIQPDNLVSEQASA